MAGGEPPRGPRDGAEQLKHDPFQLKRIML
jgi:hypothetical protein